MNIEENAKRCRHSPVFDHPESPVGLEAIFVNLVSDGLQMSKVKVPTNAKPLTSSLGELIPASNPR